MLLSFRITKEQKEALLSFYPEGIKHFVEKTISDTADKIIMEKDLFDIDKELWEYHNRRALNDNDFKKRKVSQETKDKISNLIPFQPCFSLVAFRDLLILSLVS